MASRSEPKDGRGSAAGSIDAPPVEPPSTPDKLGVRPAGRRLLRRARCDARLRPDRHQHHEPGGGGARHVRKPVPAFDRLARARRRDERHHEPRFGSGPGAPVRARGRRAPGSRPSRRGTVPGGGDRRQRGPERDPQGGRRAAPAGAALGARPARLQLPERPHDEFARLLPRRRAHRMGHVRQTAGCARRRAGAGDRRGDRLQPHLPRVSLPQRRRRRARGRDRVAVGRRARVRDDPAVLGAAPAREAAS